MSQTDYNEQVAYFEGQKGDSRYDLVKSFAAENAVPFGKLVVRGTDKEKQCTLPAAATDITNTKNALGISLQTHAIESSESGIPTYKDQDMVSVLARGVVAVKVEEAVDTTDDVYVRYASGGNGLGSFRASDPGTAAAILPNAKYVKSAAINGIALVEINLEG